jgi:1-deoxy-D-xylulose-5-phosphate reductoisomerase
LTLIDAGGPFRGLDRAALMAITPGQVCKPAEAESVRHAAVDSATLMRNGWQAMAAHALFGMPVERIETQIDPRGRTWAETESAEGALNAQDGPSDRHEALSLALAWPEPANIRDGRQPPARAVTPPYPEKPDLSTFRCLTLAYAALQAGGDAPVILHAANAVAVAAFLAGTLPFLSIADLIEQVLTELPPQPVVDNQALRERHRAACAAARQVLRNAC